jgi:hypothetical protein
MSSTDATRDVNNFTGYSTDIKLGAFPNIDDKKYPEIYAAISRLMNAVRIIQSSLDRYIQPVVVGVCGEDINAGAMVNFYNNADALTVQNAYAVDHTKPCHAFALGSFSAGQEGQFQTCGCNEFLGALDPGTVYYLTDGATPGNITATKPTVAGHLAQVVGVAISPTKLLFTPSQLYAEL